MQGQPCYNFDASGNLTVTGGTLKSPMRYGETLQAPLRLRGLVQRDRPCTNQFIVLATSATLPSQPGNPLTRGVTLAFCMACATGNMSLIMSTHGAMQG